MQKNFPNRPHIVEILQIELETPLIKTLSFSWKEIQEKALPGQFVMVWIPKIDEIPLSLSEISPYPSITVKKVGNATEALHALKEGDHIGIRGPYGHSFSLKGTSPLIVGGGIGMAPLLFLIHRLQKITKDLTVINGARTKAELLFFDKLQKLSNNGVKCIFATDDGSFGEKGLASHIAIQNLEKGNHDQVY
ncbi:MAG: dihydroorotate dehydrogenase electron transfer subunit, partial [Candidatus Helarchaeota archaeon]